MKFTVQFSDGNNYFQSHNNIILLIQPLFPKNNKKKIALP